MSEQKRTIRSPRRNRPPEQVAVNKCGAVSLLSLLRHMGLPDRLIFDVSFNTDTGVIVLTPADDVASFGDSGVEEDVVVEAVAPLTEAVL